MPVSQVHSHQHPRWSATLGCCCLPRSPDSSLAIATWEWELLHLPQATTADVSLRCLTLEPILKELQLIKELQIKTMVVPSQLACSVANGQQT